MDKIDTEIKNLENSLLKQEGLITKVKYEEDEKKKSKMPVLEK